MDAYCLSEKLMIKAVVGGQWSVVGDYPEIVLSDLLTFSLTTDH